MSVELVKLIKSVAMDAFRASKPVELIYGNVIKDYENDGELVIHLAEKLDLCADFFVFGSIRPKNLERGNRLVIIRMQGGQSYYVADILREDD
ncbi:MAG: hypothetical protein Q4D26_07730 [Clostridia bacterium]|nr:hypothetical protein [Clostridia bacterium]